MSPAPSLSAAGSWRGSLAAAAAAATAAFVVGVFGLFSMPPLDRDEARFAQATAQMLETGDYITIRFQDAERNKKPAGIHWLQAASVSAFSGVERREIWAYRAPSVLAAIIACAATALLGARLFAPATGLAAGLLLAASPGLAAEATIAKTDAMLLATITLAALAFAEIYRHARRPSPAGQDSRAARHQRPLVFWPLVFWASLGAGILIKGPIAPMVIGLMSLGMAVRARAFRWPRAFRPLFGAAVVMAMTAPWVAAVGIATEGRFFTEAIGGDMLGKVGTAQESHSGPPGYYSVLVFFLFWPAAGLILPGILQSVRTREAWPSFFLLAWAAPAWLVFELVATKLPHYTLPLYPAIALMAARAAADGSAVRWRRARRIGAVMHAIASICVAGSIIALVAIYADAPVGVGDVALAACVLAGGLAAAWFYWSGKVRQALATGIAVSAFLAWTLLEVILPKLERLEISPRISAMIDEAGLHAIHDQAPPAILIGYYEPSAVFLLGTQTRLATGLEAVETHIGPQRGAAVVEDRELAAFLARVSINGASLEEIGRVSGVNYSNGRLVNLTIFAIRRGS